LTDNKSGILTYGGLITKLFLINANWSWLTIGNANHVYSIAVFKNSVLVPGSEIVSSLDNVSNTYPRAAGLSQVLLLAANDTIELRVSNTDGIQAVLVQNIQLVVTELGAATTPPLLMEKSIVEEEKEGFEVV
jgi:hypothetical protein